MAGNLSVVLEVILSPREAKKPLAGVEAEMTAPNAERLIYGEARLGRSALTSIGRHLGAIYDDVVAQRIPQDWVAALARMRVSGDRPGDAET